jgi:hypothetical protein
MYFLLSQRALFFVFSGKTGPEMPLCLAIA